MYVITEIFGTRTTCCFVYGAALDATVAPSANPSSLMECVYCAAMALAAALVDAACWHHECPAY